MSAVIQHAGGAPTMLVAVCMLLALTMIPHSAALDDGLALTPPMGWRSWNSYDDRITQDSMEQVMAAMASRRRLVDGVPTSLADLGYVDVGLDDAYQACGAGVGGSFHDAEGNILINETKFPSLSNMTSYAHERGLFAGFYLNNCICRERRASNGWSEQAHMEREVAAVVDFGFDSLKLDGCGAFNNLTWWAELLNATGHHVMIENCHWGCTTPSGVGAPSLLTCVPGLLPFPPYPVERDGACRGDEGVSDCPYHMYRTSVDIRAEWGSMWYNLQTVVPFLQDPPLSRPGAWAYPDMLEVGLLETYEADRAHFGAWCVVSSPLVLGYDLADEAVTDRVWPIIANPEAIAVNQAWAGHPGRLARTWHGDGILDALGKLVAPALSSEAQLWTKPLGEGEVAVLVLGNRCPSDEKGGCSLSFNLTEDVGIAPPVRVRDLWSRADLPDHVGETYTIDGLGARDSVFLRLSRVE